MSELQALRGIAKARANRLKLANDTATDALNDDTTAHWSDADHWRELAERQRLALQTIQQITK